MYISVVCLVRVVLILAVIRLVSPVPIVVNLAALFYCCVMRISRIKLYSYICLSRLRPGGPNPALLLGRLLEMEALVNIAYDRISEDIILLYDAIHAYNQVSTLLLYY